MTSALRWAAMRATSYEQPADEIIYLSLHCHPQNDSCIKMGSEESHILMFD